MNRYLMLVASVTIFAAFPLFAQKPGEGSKVFPAPSEIVAAAKSVQWVVIAPTDLLVMDLAPDAKGKPRRVIIQLMPPPYGQSWIGNIRKLAQAHWWDGTAVVRVQDNYVTQWGDPTEKKPLPQGLAAVPESEYVTAIGKAGASKIAKRIGSKPDAYAHAVGFDRGWPLASVGNLTWPVHCYAMVGVGRNLSPDTGSGAELYTVIGHAPRHLDRNIAVVGRVIEGMEHLSSLPRGTAALGFYASPQERVAILSVRLASDMEGDAAPSFEYLGTGSKSFAKYADARANRRDPFFIRPAGGADICNVPVPVRRKVAN